VHRDAVAAAIRYQGIDVAVAIDVAGFDLARGGESGRGRRAWREAAVTVAEQNRNVVVPIARDKKVEVAVAVEVARDGGKLAVADRNRRSGAGAKQCHRHAHQCPASRANKPFAIHLGS
jgi:hypothetical protein